ncbi:MAG: hypothetical protein K8S56_08555 [Candidatus Cloacimonetes bacterium]|nr:hypothetical protein [Candidatus Cloacimonadota bacterium]
MKYYFILVFFAIVVFLPAEEIVTFNVPKADTVRLVASANFEMKEINESSAIVKSRVFDGVFWTLNDSGDDARIFPFSIDGKTLKPQWKDKYSGVYIPDAVNIDWEEMAVDNDGNLIIGACGNNANTRRDLALYIVKEPHPLATTKTRYWKKLPFYYPEQKEFPPEANNFDCEALFTAHGKIYLLTKHRADTRTVLYRMDTQHQLEDNALTKLSTADILGSVTAADCTPDGKKLAVLTYTAIWVFSVEEGDDWFRGEVQWMPIKAKQCEAICWDGDKLIITNEQTDIMPVPMEKLLKL